MKRLLANMLQLFSHPARLTTTYDEAFKVLKHKDMFSNKEHIHEILLRTQLYSSMGNFGTLTHNVSAVVDHLKSEPTAPIPRIHMSTFATSELYTMHSWITVGDNYATMDELIEFVRMWLYMSEVAQTIKSGITDYNVHSATPEIQRFKAINQFVDNLEPIIKTLLEYIQCYHERKSPLVL